MKNTYNLHFIPIRDSKGIPTGTYLRLKSNSQLYKQILEHCGGKLPTHIVIPYETNEN